MPLVNVTLQLDSAIVQRFVTAVNALAGNQPATQAAANQFARQWLATQVIRPTILQYEKQRDNDAKDVDTNDPINNPTNLTQS